MNLPQEEKRKENKVEAMTQRKRKFFVQWHLLTQGKVKRFYAFKIPDYSSKSLRTIFDKHISKTAQVTTDEWK